MAISHLLAQSLNRRCSSHKQATWKPKDLDRKQMTHLQLLMAIPRLRHMLLLLNSLTFLCRFRKSQLSLRPYQQRSSVYSFARNGLQKEHQVHQETDTMPGDCDGGCPGDIGNNRTPPPPRHGWAGFLTATLHVTDCIEGVQSTGSHLQKLFMMLLSLAQYLPPFLQRSSS